jgi:hypothetical protein
VRSLESRLERLEGEMPSAPRFLRLHVEVHGEPPLSEGEVAVLEAEEARQMAEAEPGQTVVALWTRERAAELGAPSPPAKEKGLRVAVEVQDGGHRAGCAQPPAEPPREALPAEPQQFVTSEDTKRDQLDYLAALARGPRSPQERR